MNPAGTTLSLLGYSVSWVLGVAGILLALYPTKVANLERSRWRWAVVVVFIALGAAGIWHDYSQDQQMAAFERDVSTIPSKTATEVIQGTRPAALHAQWSHASVKSKYQDKPYAVQVTLIVNVQVSPLTIEIKCDHDMTGSQIDTVVTGAAMVDQAIGFRSQPMAKLQKNIAVVTISLPNILPGTPVVETISSKFPFTTTSLAVLNGTP